MSMYHDWIPTTVGHGEKQCRKCHITLLEAQALGIDNDCDIPEGATVPPPIDTVQITAATVSGHPGLSHRLSVLL